MAANMLQKPTTGLHMEEICIHHAEFLEVGDYEAMRHAVEILRTAQQIGPHRPLGSEWPTQLPIQSVD